MSRKIRIGVISTSWWADAMYLPSLTSHPQAEIVAICGRNHQRAAEMAEKYKIPKIFSDYKIMIEKGGLEAIIIGAPDDLHYDITMQSLAAGLHVLCDKPLALRLDQASEMWQKAEAAKVNHMVLFTYRWMPFFRYTRDLIDRNYIGRFYHGEFSFLVGNGRKPGYQWRLDGQRSNGALGDLGSHMIDMARWLVSDIAQVEAHLQSFINHPGAEGGQISPANDSAFLLVEFATGGHAVIQASFVAYLAEQDMRMQVKLYGENGSLEITFPAPGQNGGANVRGARDREKAFQDLPVPHKYWADVKPTEPFGIFTRQAVGCRLFIDAILENRPVAPNFYDGYKVQQIMAAALESDHSGRRIAIDNSV